MSEKPVISCKNVSIRYITGDFKSIGLKEYIVRRLTGNYKVNEFWADKEISFELKQGDMLAIIGTNGAGKSTLLKALSGIMVPSRGSIKVKGKIAALLELTSGFDKEMTVRENTFLRGAMLGYTKKFMHSMYDSIISFAELQDFQNHPFKQLSSGMKSRLAFAIACLVNPDILILDEVLSVGDGAFRQKSHAKMKEILSQGITGILVSHSISQVREMCNKVLWLDHGKQVCFSEDVEQVCNAYEIFLQNRELPQTPEAIAEYSEQFLLSVKQQKKQAAVKLETSVKKFMLANTGGKGVKIALQVLEKFGQLPPAAEKTEKPAEAEKKP